MGFTAGTGLACTEIKNNGVSQVLEKIGGWISDLFSDEGASSSASLSEPWDPIPSINQTWDKVAEATTTVVGIFPMSYQWIKVSENSKFLMTFFKNFWNYSFLENVVFNFHWIIRSWLGILIDADTLSKFPDAFATFKKLAKFLSKEESQTNGEKNMINWLYLRFIVNPRRTIGILSRHQKSSQSKGEEEEGLKCNGKQRKKKKPEGSNNLPLGSCFICQDGKKLIQEMTDFLTKGEIPKDKKEKKEK